MSRGTRTRMATHGSGIVRGGRCIHCTGQHVVEHLVHGRPLRLCGFCGETWRPGEDQQQIRIVDELVVDEQTAIETESAA